VKELSLFSGAGGGLLGTKLLGWECYGYVEYDDYCQRVIAQRIEDGILDQAPIFGDIKAFISEGYADAYSGLVDVVTAGFPCQPFSVAGKRAGQDDDRNMWPQTIDVIRRVRPRFALLENVSGLLTHEYGRKVFGDLAKNRFNARWSVFRASDANGQHRRERLFIIADSDMCGSKRAKEKEDRFFRYTRVVEEKRWGFSESELYGVPNGLANRMDRLKAIGNGQVPAVVRAAWELMQ